MNEAVARDIVRQYHGNAATIAVRLAETIISDGRWSANVCKPLLRAYEIARAISPADPPTCPNCGHREPHTSRRGECPICGCDAPGPGPSPAALPDEAS